MSAVEAHIGLAESLDVYVAHSEALVRMSESAADEAVAEVAVAVQVARLSLLIELQLRVAMGLQVADAELCECKFSMEQTQFEAFQHALASTQRKGSAAAEAAACQAKEGLLSSQSELAARPAHTRYQLLRVTAVWKEV